MSNFSCAFTGHRPARFPFGYNEDDERCVQVKAVISEQINALVVNGVTEFYSGMALGVDQWAAEIVLEMKKTHSNLRLIAVRPCETQADRWSANQRERHYNTLAHCDVVYTLQTKYTRSCIFERNKYLVDRAKYLLAVYDGRSNGGTAYTVRYARQQGRWIITIHPETLVVT
ncbi:MAG: DUF1273 domain-containing protein [Oscillospiraceae bacterium]|nr:DUF1273 domain-containing protein [Oscillospiraceae bacterium]